MQSIKAPSLFDPHRDYVTLTVEWPKWKRAFELYLKALKIEESTEKENMLLHCAGIEVQELYDTLSTESNERDNEIGTDKYALAISRLDKYFIRKVNTDVEKAKFRRIIQEPGESIDKFVFRLRKQAQVCGFVGNQVNENIREQIIEKVNSRKLKQKILTRDLSLDQIIEEAHIIELNEVDNPQNYLKKNEPQEVYSIQKRENYPGKFSSFKCFRCGLTGHLSKDPVCPARGKRYRKCNAVGHFESTCTDRNLDCNCYHKNGIFIYLLR